jgi:hypothetical protein
MQHRSYIGEEHFQKWDIFNEYNIRNNHMTFGEMAREVYGISYFV